MSRPVGSVTFEEAYSYCIKYREEHGGCDGCQLTDDSWEDECFMPAKITNLPELLSVEVDL